MIRTAAGHALFVTMIVLLLVASAVGLVASHYGLQARIVSQEARRIHLTALTDAAVAESLARLDETSGYDGIPRREFGGGTITSRIDPMSGDRRKILASATYRGWTRTVRVQVRIEETGLVVESWTPTHSLR